MHDETCFIAGGYRHRRKRHYKKVIVLAVNIVRDFIVDTNRTHKNQTLNAALTHSGTVAEPAGG